jgi:Flp pilus assembly protein TadG
MGKSAKIAAPSPGTNEPRGRARHRGQSLVEFAVVLPVMLAFVGIIIDASRLYQAWTNLESATRDAAQYLARSNTDPLSADYTTQGTDSDAKAIYLLTTATGVTFSRSSTQGSLTDCTAPRLTTTYTQDTAVANGGTATNPAGNAKVMTCMPFRTLFAYPFLTTNGGMVLRSERDMTVIVGR